MQEDELVKAILWVVEGIVDQRTTERVFYGYDGDDELTEDGKIAAELIKILLKIKKVGDQDGREVGEVGEGAC